MSGDIGYKCIKHFSPTSAENFECVLESPGRFKNLPMPWFSPQINYITVWSQGPDIGIYKGSPGDSKGSQG